MYQVTSVMIPVAEDVDPVTEDPVITTTMVQCSICPQNPKTPKPQNPTNKH